MTDLEKLCINTIRFLSADAVQKAESGHPGAPMGAAAAAFTLWDRHLTHNPTDPSWPDRDRFVLSAGHASMLLYSLLHLTGYDLPLEELKNFRQWDSMTPGHPEYGEAPGVETTTGPLGQGFGNGVGMAIAERWLACTFNKPGHTVVDHHTYALVSDGDLQEGIASEAASLAGHLGLGKLIYLYDDNKVQIEGSTDLAFSEDVGARFASYGWQVLGPLDGDDMDAVDEAIASAKAEEHKPSIIICQTTIGLGSPTQGTAKTHGSPLGEENLQKAKEALGWPYSEHFTIPEEVSAHMHMAVDRGKAAQSEWEIRMRAYAKSFPEEAASLARCLAGDLPIGWEESVESIFDDAEGPMATRAASGQTLNALAKVIPNLVGGSADLAPSTKTIQDDKEHFAKDAPCGNNLHFGVREHAMGAICSGMALHGGVVPYGATFLTFSDYMRPSIRLAALMGLRVVYVFTHDSIGLGEDGPTHQSVEHLLALRAIPNLTVLRPADAFETVACWPAALRHTSGPTAMALSRQKLAILQETRQRAGAYVIKGGYVLWESDPEPEAIIIGTGSETHIALEAAKTLAAEGTPARCVSLPSWELFDAQPEEYRHFVIPRTAKARVAVEAGVTLGWDRYVGESGRVVGVDRFGASAPYEEVYEHLGVTVEAVIKATREQL